MIENPSYTFSIYGISSTRGFLPDHLPLRQLPGASFRPWEAAIDQLPVLIRSGLLRSTVDRLPIFDTDLLKTEPDWRRAYVIFSFLSHAYIWAGPKPSERLPTQITVPFLIIADHFILPTTATYAGLNLWNWKPIRDGVDITMPENLQVLHTFTGTDDEAWFYLISVSIEAKAASIIPVILECFDAAKCDNTQMVLLCLARITACVNEMGGILERMYERCDTQVFYHQIRPFLAGSKGMEAAGLARGVFYDEGNGVGTWRQYSGGSNAQSSVIQLLDIVLGIEHKSMGKVTTNQNGLESKTKPNYLKEMRNYMPGSHRHFLTYATSIANLNEYVRREDANPAVQLAFAAAVASLTSFRDKHIQIVSRYIIVPSQKVNVTKYDNSINIATTSCSNGKSDRQTMLAGTGGTTLIPFLKRTRDETMSAAILS